MPRTTASISADVNSGTAARRLMRARLVMPSRGPISRPVTPPSQEAQSSGNRPSAPINNAASHASIRYRQAMRDGTGSGGGKASVITDSLNEGRDQRVERGRVAPGQRDVEHLDTD